MIRYVLSSFLLLLRLIIIVIIIVVLLLMLIVPRRFILSHSFPCSDVLLSSSSPETCTPDGGTQNMLKLANAMREAHAPSQELGVECSHSPTQGYAGGLFF